MFASFLGDGAHERPARRLRTDRKPCLRSVVVDGNVCTNSIIHPDPFFKYSVTNVKRDFHFTFLIHVSARTLPLAMRIGYIFEIRVSKKNKPIKITEN